MTKRPSAVSRAAADREVLAAQGRALRAAERLFQKARGDAELAATRARRAQQALHTASDRRTADGLRRELEAARAARQQARARCKEATALLGEQRQLRRLLQRRGSARERALSAFLRRWERDYERRLAVLRKNIALRKRWMRP